VIDDISALDERALARKYGLRELVWPDVDQLKALARFLDDAISTAKCGPVPKTAVVVMIDFIQGTLNRQNITKAPHMAPEEFDALEAPYYLAARIISKMSRDKRDAALAKGRTYQVTQVTLYKFLDLLRNLLDPSCPWLRSKTIPNEALDVMEVLRAFIDVFPEQRRKGRAL